uniref:Uncharacterized protein n=1 Tax=Oryza rufipogon TaxID=4529 RepID=A0A1Y8Z848_ORYRU
MFVFCVM